MINLRKILKEKLKKRRAKKELIGVDKKIQFIAMLSLIIGILSYLFIRNIIISTISIFGIFALCFFYIYMKDTLKESSRTKKIEAVYPDFLQLMASNLRAGITIDKSMLLSARKEFSPLDKEISKTGKEIATGKKVDSALLDMAKRIGSEKIHRTTLLIISGINAGGNIATLLEETSIRMRERNYVEKKAASTILMYIIFIFIAVAVGAPALFSLSSILVETLTKLLSGIPTIEASVNLPFTMSSISIPVGFIKWFCIIFMIVIDILAALVLGLVNKGEEKEGFKYILPLILISLAVFFALRFFLSGFVAEIFA